MKADFSRDTFDPTRHYRRVLGQQGRVVLDADLNEQTSIDIGISEQTTSDVIGPSGVPETSLSFGYNGGFEIGISADGTDLTIAHGRIYVDGVLVENDADTTFRTQPFLPLAKNALGRAEIRGERLYGVYLDAWERAVTPIDDPAILETALGGPDTALRSQIAWQVKLGEIDITEFGENPPCAQILPPWGQRGTPGKLAAQGGAPSTDPLPCVLPPQTGFRSLENQLYRVEIHTPGSYGTATFKWSRENASVVVGIVSQLTGAFASPTFSVQSVGRDASLGFAPGDWVELIDDDAEFQRGIGELLQVATVDPSAMTISLQTAPTTTIDPAKHPKLRRWDQTQNAGATGVPIVDGSWIDLENGVQVRFSADTFAVGDYWLIPARTATSAQTVGSVEWPIDPATNAPALQAPRGVVHHYAKLAIVRYASGKFAPPQGASAVTDCRLFFPPLTSIQPQQGPCTLVLQPGANWTAPLVALFANAPAIDAEICFAVGEFATTQPIAIATSGNVKVSGAGWGTKLVGTGLESVLQFAGCASVCVRDLAATATTVGGPPDAADKASKQIHGVLDFTNCADVFVQNVALECASALLPGASCITIRSDPTTNVATGRGSATVLDAQLTVGETQYGILLVHQQRGRVERTTIQPAARSTLLWQDKLKNAQFRQELVRLLVGNAVLPASAGPSSGSSASSASSSSASSIAGRPSPRLALGRVGLAANAGVTVGKTTVAFNSPAGLENVWQTYADLHGPKEFANVSDLYTFVRQAATTLVTDPSALARFPSLQSYLAGLERTTVVVGDRGIAIGGRGFSELTIRGNSITGMQKAIALAVSHKEKRPPALPADKLGRATICDNAIAVALDPVRGRTKGRWGIFVGNAANVLIENNEVSLAVRAAACDGIRVYGYLGPKVIVRHNHVRGFPRDIFVRALLPSGPKHDQVYWFTQPPKSGSANANLWLVADNVAEGRHIDAQACMVVDNWP